jgi:sporulation protein YlmC with PRC-barrel domain
MKSGITLLSALMLAGSGSVLAQQVEQPGQQPGQQQPGVQPGEQDRQFTADDQRHDGEAITARKDGDIRSDELVGSEVLDSFGEKIGDVNELLIEDDGRVAALLVNVGETLGIGGRTVAISWDEANVERTREDGV